MNRDELIAAILPELGKVPMVDAPQSRIREIQAGWIADAILSRLQPPGDGESVPVPVSADQAAAMVLFGAAWLKDHAPDRLKPSYADGYAKAVGDAAKVAIQYQPQPGYPQNYHQASVDIATAIRALAGKDEV